MASDDPRVIGPQEAAQVRELLRERGVKQGELAVRTGMWPGDLASALNGHKFISPEKRERLDAEVKRLRDGSAEQSS